MNIVCGNAVRRTGVVPTKMVQTTISKMPILKILLCDCEVKKAIATCKEMQVIPAMKVVDN
jgi:hypothetical protein